MLNEVDTIIRVVNGIRVEETLATIVVMVVVLGATTILPCITTAILDHVSTVVAVATTKHHPQAGLIQRVEASRLVVTTAGIAIVVIVRMVVGVVIVEKPFWYFWSCSPSSWRSLDF
mmetsp:Transcript_70305/g.194561  ORF Transcript_70305/g.194561 Transcript_70305/m.194561 type:complete len:117 (-) Transcript_70305:167-517(-)